MSGRITAAIALGTLACVLATVPAGAVVTYPVHSSGTDLMACDCDNCCDAMSDLQGLLETGYDGWIGFNHHWFWLRENLGSWQAEFEVEIDGELVVDVTLYEGGGGTETSWYHCSSGTEEFDINLGVWVHKSGNLKCHDSDTLSLQVIRPECDSTVDFNPVETYWHNDDFVTISGSVTDDACGATVNGSACLVLQVEGPGVSETSDALDVSDGTFEWTYHFPSPKVGHYGEYVVTADYDGSNDDHPLRPDPDPDDDGDPAASERFYLEAMIPIEDQFPPSAGDYLPSGPPGYEDPQFAFPVEREGAGGHTTTWIDFYDVEGEGKIRELEVDQGIYGAVPSPRGLTVSQEFYPSRQGPQALLRYYESPWYFGVYSLEAGDTLWTSWYDHPVWDPRGLAFDGEGLWIAGGSESWAELCRIRLSDGAVLDYFFTDMAGPWGDIAFDWNTGVLLAHSLMDDLIYKVEPSSGSLLDIVYPAPAAPGCVLVDDAGGIWVSDRTTHHLYLCGLPPGTPERPTSLSAESSAETPHSITLAWEDPDGTPQWDRIRIYRDGAPCETVAPGVGTFVDDGLAEHSYHEYYVTAYRTDGAESGPSNTAASYAGTRPPVTLSVPGDYETIQLAIYNSMDGDTVLVDPGTYCGPIRFLGREILVQSAAGPSETFITGEDYPFSLVTFDLDEGPDAVFSGFTITGGRERFGGIVYCGPDASPTIEGNVIVGNEVSSSSGVIFCDGNRSGSPLIKNNTIVYNTAIPDTLGFFQGGAIYCRDSSPVITGNIIAFTQGSGYGIYCEGSSSPDLSCNDVWANPLGAYSGCAAGPGDIALDPLFCDAGSWDFHLCEDSPCAPFSPPNDECDVIGALPVGCGECGPSPVEGSFVANVTESGTVVLHWSVGSLAGIEGFNVYRATSPDGTFARLNEEIVPAESPCRFEDATVWPETTFWYEVRAILSDGTEDAVDAPSASVTTGGRLIMRLYPPRPNPSTGATRIEFDVPSHVGPVRVGVYHISGRLVKTLVDGPVERGRRSASWDGMDSVGRPASSGVYFVRFELDGQLRTEKVALIR